MAHLIPLAFSSTATTGGGVDSGGGGNPFTKKSASDIRKSRHTHTYRLLICTSTGREQIKNKCIRSLAAIETLTIVGC